MITSHKRLLLLYPTILIYSCTPAGNIAGDYSSSKSPYSFIINNDSTFSYRYKFQVAYEYSQGIWKQLSKNKITLTSYTATRLIPLRVQEGSLQKNSEIDDNILSVDVGIPDSEKTYYQCSIFINDTLFRKTSCDSLQLLTIDQKINSLFFSISADERIPTRFLDTLYSEKILFKSANRRKLNIDFVYQDSLFNYRVFNDEVLNVSGTYLKFYDSLRMHLEKIPKMK
jgi:hypothetical protein